MTNVACILQQWDSSVEFHFFKSPSYFLIRSLIYTFNNKQNMYYHEDQVATRYYKFLDFLKCVIWHAKIPAFVNRWL